MYIVNMILESNVYISCWKFVLQHKPQQYNYEIGFHWAGLFRAVDVNKYKYNYEIGFHWAGLFRAVDVNKYKYNYEIGFHWAGLFRAVDVNLTVSTFIVYP